GAGIRGGGEHDGGRGPLNICGSGRYARAVAVPSQGWGSANVGRVVAVAAGAFLEGTAAFQHVLKNGAWRDGARFSEVGREETFRRVEDAFGGSSRAVPAADTLLVVGGLIVAVI